MSNDIIIIIVIILRLREEVNDYYYFYSFKNAAICFTHTIINNINVRFQEWATPNDGSILLHLGSITASLPPECCLPSLHVRALCPAWVLPPLPARESFISSLSVASPPCTWELYVQPECCLLSLHVRALCPASVLPQSSSYLPAVVHSYWIFNAVRIKIF